MIRGDEELFSIMDEMAPPSSSPSSSTNDNHNNNRINIHNANDINNYNVNKRNYRIRLLPEINGYGDSNRNKNQERKQKGKHHHQQQHQEDLTLWNPYVQIDISFPLEQSLMLTSPAKQQHQQQLHSLIFIPTNPDVEVIRRRVYEKFKSQFHSNFQWVVKNSNNNNNHHSNNTNTGNDNHEIFKELLEQIPSHNILERFHFASKLEESIKIMMSIISNNSLQQYKNDISYSSYLHDWNTNDIQTLWIKYKGNGTIMDPILLSSTLPSIIISHENNNISNNINLGKSKQMQKQINSNKNNNKNESENHNIRKNNHERITNHVLFKNEIKFQLTREMKKKKSFLLSSSAQHTATQTNKKSKLNKDDDIKLVEDFNTYLKSAHFQRKCKRLSKDIDTLSIDMEREFIMQVMKRSSDLAISSSKSSSNKRRGVPKVLLQEQRSISNNLNSNDSNIQEVMTVTYSGLTFRISLPHYKKLQILFDRNNTNSISLHQHQDLFYKKLFAALCRYDMLEGGGLQSALSGNVFDVLLKELDCNMECFASPFNCRYERYCSAFPDTDVAFGSLGSFFDLQFETFFINGGCFQANPPFAADFILAMYKRMERLLTNENVTAPFMFIVFIPAWNYAEGWQALAQSPVLSKSMLLSQKDDPHYYCEGTQHRRLSERYRVASFDTSVFFLQNEAAREKWSITDEIIEEIKIAFATNPDDEVKVHDKIRTKKRAPLGDDKKVTATEISSTSGSKQMNDTEKVSMKANYKGSQSRKKRQNTIPENKKKHTKKKKLVDDSSKQFDILSSIGLFDKGNKNKKK